jgi:hypothetical protein
MLVSCGQCRRSGCGYVSLSRLIDQCRKPLVLIGSRHELVDQLAAFGDLTHGLQTGFPRRPVGRQRSAVAIVSG